MTFVHFATQKQRSPNRAIVLTSLAGHLMAGVKPNPCPPPPGKEQVKATYRQLVSSDIGSRWHCLCIYFSAKSGLLFYLLLPGSLSDCE